MDKKYIIYFPLYVTLADLSNVDYLSKIGYQHRRELVIFDYRANAPIITEMRSGVYTNELPPGFMNKEGFIYFEGEWILPGRTPLFVRPDLNKTFAIASGYVYEADPLDFFLRALDHNNTFSKAGNKDSNLRKPYSCFIVSNIEDMFILSQYAEYQDIYIYNEKSIDLSAYHKQFGGNYINKNRKFNAPYDLWQLINSDTIYFTNRNYLRLFKKPLNVENIEYNNKYFEAYHVNREGKKIVL